MKSDEKRRQAKEEEYGKIFFLFGFGVYIEKIILLYTQQDK